MENLVILSLEEKQKVENELNEYYPQNDYVYHEDVDIKNSTLTSTLQVKVG